MLFLFEYQAKIIGGGKTAQLGNFPNAFVGVDQHRFRFRQTYVQQKIDRGAVGVSFEIIDKGGFGNEKLLRQIV